MSEPPAWVRDHAIEMRDHWWWRPGWKVGRQFYTWHYTFEGQPAFHELTASHQRVLENFSTLDLIPQRWLHLTVQGRGFPTDVADSNVQQIGNAVDVRMKELPPATVTLGRAIVRPEAIALVPDRRFLLGWRVSPLAAARSDVWGAENVPESAADFQPHVSIAYNKDTADAAPIAAALTLVPMNKVDVHLRHPQLIELHRDRPMYEWQTVA